MCKQSLEKICSRGSIESRHCRHAFMKHVFVLLLFFNPNKLRVHRAVVFTSAPPLASAAAFPASSLCNLRFFVDFFVDFFFPPRSKASQTLFPGARDFSGSICCSKSACTSENVTNTPVRCRSKLSLESACDMRDAKFRTCWFHRARANE